MKLNTQTGSLINHLYSISTIDQPVPSIGMGVTVLSWTDRKSATIVDVFNLQLKNWEHEISVVEDNVKIVSGSCHDGSAVYECSADTSFDSHKRIFRFNKAKQEWVEGFCDSTTGRWKAYKNSKGLILGIRENYYDPSF